MEEKNIQTNETVETMNAETKKLLVDYELCSYIESLQYDVESLKDLLVRMSGDTPTNIINYWKDAYLDKSKEYMLAKQLIEREIKNSGIVDKNSTFSWNLDFSTREVTII